MNVSARTLQLIDRWQSRVPLVLGLAGLISMWWVYPHNYEISDPSQYARQAFLVSKGRYLQGGAPNIFGHRLGVLLPVAAVYALFGVTPHTTDLVPLLAGCAILVVVWRVLPPPAATPAVLTVVTCVPLLHATMELFPDLISTAFLLVSIFALSRRGDVSLTPRPQVALALFGVFAWFCAMLAKESAWWGLPVWASAFLVDAWRKRKQTLLWFHAPALLAGLLFCAGYLIFCAHYFGDALAHLHSMQELVGKHAWTIHGEDHLRVRLTSGAALFFWKQYGVLLIPAALGMVVLPAPLRIWALYTALTTLLYWFGSISFTSYQPLPTMPRMSLPCAPGFCICAAYFLHFLSLRVAKLLGQARASLFLSGLAAVALFSPVHAYIQSWHRFADLDAMARIEQEAKEHPMTRYLVISAEKRSDFFVFLYFGFNPPTNVSLSYAGDLDRTTLEQAQVVFLFVDQRHYPKGRDYAKRFRALHLPTLFKQGDATVFLAEDHDRIAALLL